MAVEFVTYRDKKIPIKVGYYALKMLRTEHGIDIEKIDDNWDAFEPLLFYSLKQGHKREGVEFPFKMEDMEDVLDDCFMEFIDKVANFFPQDELAKMMGEVEAKKKKK